MFNSRRKGPRGCFRVRTFPIHREILLDGATLHDGDLRGRHRRPHVRGGLGPQPYKVSGFQQRGERVFRCGSGVGGRLERGLDI